MTPTVRATDPNAICTFVTTLYGQPNKLTVNDESLKRLFRMKSFVQYGICKLPSLEFKEKNMFKLIT